MILVLSDLWPPFPGGAERLAFNLSRDLLRRGHEVRAATSYERAQCFDGPHVAWRDIGIGERHTQGGEQLLRLLEQYEPALVLTHHLFAYEFETELIAYGAPVVQLVLNTRRLGSAALAVYISGWVRDTLGDAHAGDLVVLPPAFDDVIASEHSSAVGFIKPYPHKGAALVYEIAREMPERPFVVLRGEWQTLELMPETELANVTFVEPVDDIRDFYALVDLVIMPSESEDAGTVGQECALNEIPCLSTPVGGLSETNSGGVLIDSREAWVWAHEIRRLDDADRYSTVVERQALTQLRQAQQLDRFAAAIEKLL